MDDSLPEPPGGLARALAAGCAAATADLAAGAPLAWRVEAGRHAVCRLAEYPERGVSSDAEGVAAVVIPLRGPRPASALVAFEPKPALALVRAAADPATWQPGDASRALADYRDVGGRVARALAEALLPGSEAGPAALVEEALPVALVATHAPRETLVVSAALRFQRTGAQALDAVACLLLDAKDLALSGGPPPSPDPTD